MPRCLRVVCEAFMFTVLNLWSPVSVSVPLLLAGIVTVTSALLLEVIPVSTMAHIGHAANKKPDANKKETLQTKINANKKQYKQKRKAANKQNRNNAVCLLSRSTTSSIYSSRHNCLVSSSTNLFLLSFYIGI